jgi:hypothetical protein
MLRNKMVLSVLHKNCNAIQKSLELIFLHFFVNGKINITILGVMT